MSDTSTSIAEAPEAADAREEPPARRLGPLLTPMVTPFDEDLKVDFDTAGRLAALLVEDGSDGVVLADVTGEGQTLTDDERVELVRRVRAVLPDAAVVAATGGSDTRRAVELSRRLADAGADAVVCPVPCYSLPSREGICQHVELVARLARVPVIVQNAPARSGTGLSAGGAIMCCSFPGVAGVWEASGDLEHLSLLCGAGTDEPLQVWVGEEFFVLPALAVGAQGVISVASHLAGRAVRDLVEAHLAGERERAQALYAGLFPLFRALDAGRTNPAPLKAALEWLGLPGCHHRLPVARPPQARVDAIVDAVREAGELVTLRAPEAAAGRQRP